MTWKGSPSQVLARKNVRILLVDLRSSFGCRLQLLQVYCSGSTRSVVITTLKVTDVRLWPTDDDEICSFGNFEMNVVINHFNSLLVAKMADIYEIMKEWANLKRSV